MSLTEKQIALVHKLRKQGKGGRMKARRIAKITGIAEDDINALLGLAPRIKYIDRRSLGTVQHMAAPKIEIPESILIERARAYESHVPLSVALLGDPRPGRSALDKKRSTTWQGADASAKQAGATHRESSSGQRQ